MQESVRLDKKETIVQVAQRLFSRFGLMKTTVDEIAKLARIGKGTIYYYFRSKEAIFEEVINKEFAFLKEKIQEAIHKEKTPQRKLRAFVLTKMLHLKELANYYSTLYDDYLEHYAFVEKARRRNVDEEMAIVQSILDDGVGKGIFFVKDIRLTALGVVSALKGLETPWAFESDVPDLERNIDVLLNILFKGIESRSA